MISFIILYALCSLIINPMNAYTASCGGSYSHYLSSGDTDYYYISLSSSYHSITISTCGTTWDTKVYFYDSSGYQLGYCDDSGSGCGSSCYSNSQAAVLSYSTSSGFSSYNTYKIAVEGYSSSSYGTYSLSITCSYSYTPTPTYYLAPSPTYCPSYADYQCNDGDCIPTSYVCDDYDDCSDGDDENGCSSSSTSYSSGGVWGGSTAAILVIILICVLVFFCNRRRRVYGNQYKAGLLANAGGPGPASYPAAKPRVIVANPKPQPNAAQMGFVAVSSVTVSQTTVPQQRVVTNAQGQRVVYASQPIPNQGAQPVIMRPAAGPVPVQPQTQGAPVVVGVTPQQRPPITIQGQQPKIVYVQAPQSLGPNGQPARGPPPVYVQPVQSGQAPVQNQVQPAPVIVGNGIQPQVQVRSQPGGPGIDGMESEEKAPPPAFADPNALQPPPQYQKQSSEGKAGATGAQLMNKVEDDAPPPYMDINPSAPGLSLSAAEAQDLQEFLRQNELDAHDASLREAGAETLDDLKELKGDEIKQVAIDAGMDETDQKMFIGAVMKLQQ